MLHEESQKQVEYGRDDVALEGAEGDRLYVARRVGEILAGGPVRAAVYDVALDQGALVLAALPVVPG